MQSFAFVICSQTKTPAIIGVTVLKFEARTIKLFNRISDWHV